MLADERLIGVVQVEKPRQLLGGGIAGEASVTMCLAVRKEADRTGRRYAAIAGFAARLPSSSVARSRG